ncbi:glycoside hydrolase superfamily [Umbelopsis sp. AD052]|nr:glycoside hydrolase superfamily [Umbelopsis sp. AD052]
MDTDESYSLTIPVSGKAVITAKTVYGALHAIETFSQIVQYSPSLHSYVIPNAPWKISDYPKYKHRGLLLDTSRHYYAVKDIEKTIDTLSWNKMNVLHWHMIDSTSFPYKSKAYPQLAEKGSYSPAHQYDAKTISAVVQYAKERGVRVIPELEAPGHSTSWGYGVPEIVSCVNHVPYLGYTVQPPSGQLNIAKNETKEVVNKIIDEWSELFTDSFFHASGDEVVMACWTNDTTIASYLKEHNMSVNELFEKFVLDLQDHVRSHNKTVMVWQEMLLEYKFALPKDTVIQVWVGSSGVKQTTEMGYKTVVSSSDYWYLDVGYGKPRSNPYPDVPGAGYNHWNRVYSYDIRANLTKAEADLIIGGECTLWGELADHTNFEGKIWPRASAVAERLWSGYETPSGENITSADAILRLLPWRERMLLRGTMASPLNQGFCTRNPLDCFQPPE